jgi:3-oxoacyl-[acyl-carrier protein] reductase
VNIENLTVGESRQCELVVSAQHVQTFGALSGDTNPLHMDDAVAAEFGFPRRVAHGMVALGAISRLIGTELPGPGALWISQDVQFSAPVFIGDVLTACVTVEQLSNATGVVVLHTEVRNNKTAAVVLSGTAKVRILKRVAGETGEAKNNMDRVALVTGSSRGVGRAIAEALAADGHKVLVHYAERESDARTVVEAISAAGGTAEVSQADLRRPGGAEALFERAEAVFGRVDIVVNSATPVIHRKAALEWTWPEFQTYLDVYVRSAMRLTQLAAPGMQKRGFGRIINVLSSYAFGVPPAKLAAYVTAKSALAGLSRALAVELGPMGITVNMLAPSMLLTEQTANVGDRARQLAAAQTPMRRLAALQDVAQAARFLAGDGAGFITGAVLPVAGGEIMP